MPISGHGYIGLVLSNPPLRESLKDALMGEVITRDGLNCKPGR